MRLCPRCRRPEEATEVCVDRETLGCPALVTAIPGKDILMICRGTSCDKQFVVSASMIAHRTIPAEISCKMSPCGMVFAELPPSEEATKDARQEASPRKQAPSKRPPGKPG